MEAEKSKAFESIQKIHFDMLDMLGMLHNVQYFLVAERARTDFWRSIGVLDGKRGINRPHVIVRNEINYHASIYRAQDVTVRMRIAEVGRTSMTTAFEIFMADGKLAADGRIILVHMDDELRQPAPWPDEFRALVAPYADSMRT